MPLPGYLQGKIVGRIGRHRFLVDPTAHLELSDRSVERSGSPRGEILDRNRYRRGRQVFPHLLHRLPASEKVVEQRLPARRGLHNDLRDGIQAELLNVQLPGLLRIEQHFPDNLGVVHFPVQRLPLPAVSLHIEILHPETVECRILNIIQSSQLHPRINFECGPDRLSFEYVVAVDRNPHQQIVGPQLRRPRLPRLLFASAGARPD